MTEEKKNRKKSQEQETGLGIPTRAVSPFPSRDGLLMVKSVDEDRRETKTGKPTMLPPDQAHNE